MMAHFPSVQYPIANGCQTQRQAGAGGRALIVLCGKEYTPLQLDAAMKEKGLKSSFAPQPDRYLITGEGVPFGRR